MDITAVTFSTPSVDPCYTYTSLDEPQRSAEYSHYKNFFVCDYYVEWNGWYRLLYNGQNAQMPESCVYDGMCGTYYPLWLSGPHPQLEDGVVTRPVCVSSWNGCCALTSHPIRVKACPGNYYVYEFVKSSVCGVYCIETSSQFISSASTTIETIPSTESITPPITNTDNDVNIMSQFYPFGTEDTVNGRTDGGSSSVIYLQPPFIFFGQTYNQIYVNNNGHLTFDSAWSSNRPYQFPAYGGKDLIAPFWTDIDTEHRWKGVISYQQYTSGSVLTQATQDINQYFPDLSFSASWVFVATWDRVAYCCSSRDEETSFQVVLISNGYLSFVVMNYGAIAPTQRYVQAGYDTIDSSHHFSITGSLQNDITALPYSSNVNVPGRWAFRTDHGTRGCQFNGFPVQLGDSFWSDVNCQQRCTCTRSGLQCSFETCTYSQACRPAAFQYSCQNIQRQTCTISGDPHYYTFDNQIFHFQGTCTYVLSEACGNGLPYYRIEGKNEHWGSTHVSWTRMVRVFVYNEEIELVKDHHYEAKVNGTFLASPFTLHNGSIQVYQSGFSLVISTDFGLLVTYDAYSYVTISVPYDYQNATCGLCGNYNLHPEDDFRSISGEILSSDVDFANSWKVDGDTDPECHDVRCTGLACAVCTSSEMSLYSDTNHCGILGDVWGPFASCHSVFSPQTYIENCVYDLCSGGGYQPILCQALNVYSAQCQQQGVQLGQWRQPGFCEMICPEHSHFESHGSGCPATCSNQSAPINCPLPRQESCICDDGYILSAGQCVPEVNCGCTFEGFYYSEGQSVVLDEDCGRQCVCSSRSMLCYQHQCGPAEVCGLRNGVRSCRPISYATCSVEGLGSYHTFDGQTFRYPGACGLTLARVMGPSQLPYFVLTVEKVPRGLQGFSRFLKFEAGGTHVSIELGEGSNVQVDGQVVGLPISVGSSQIRIYHSSVRGFVLKTNFGVTIRADWPHIVRITAPTTYNGTLGGLCGNLNGNINDEFYSPDGVLLDDSQLFADSWRDGSLSAQCEDPADIWEPGLYQNRSEFRERCSIMAMNDGPFAECSRTLDPWQRIEDCIQMLEQTEGAREALCEALRGYTLHCQQNGIVVGEWRSITHCDPNCPANTHFELCGTSCPASCPSLSFPFQCALPCQGGCQCNDGLVLDGDRCVPPTGCGCHYDGRYRQPGKQFWHGEECQSLCVCDGITGNVRCTPSSCSEQEICRVVEGEYGCHPNPHGNCYTSGDPHYISFDRTYFDFQGKCRYVLATVCNDTHGLPHFQVEARNEAWNGLSVSITVEVFVNVSGHLVHMSRDMNSYSAVKIDEETRNLPVYLDSGRVSVYSTGQFIYVSTNFGFSVSYGGSSEVNIVVPAEYSGVMCGICGNFNGHPEDDFLTPSGALASTADQFGAAWKVEEDMSCNDDNGDRGPGHCQDESTTQALCQIIRDHQGPFSFCHGSVDPQVYFHNCVFDVCISGNSNSVLCRSIQSYVSACQSVNAMVYPWRELASCVMDCSSNIPNSHYEVCSTDCGHTCASSIDASCEHTCSEGCFCDEGFVRSGGLCVPVEQCGCLYDGFYYHIGEQFWDSTCSQHCQCFAPNDLRCTASFCPVAMECVVRNGHRDCYSTMSTCTVWGDPHYITFDGAVAHFQGTCSYEIAQTCGNVTDSDLEFRVVATNRHRGNMVVSFVSAVDVWLSQHGQQTHITIGQNRRVKVDGNPIDTPAYQINDLVGLHEEQGFVILNASNEFIVHFDGHNSLLVRVSQRFYGSLCGMCGNFNSNPADDKVLPSGELASDDISFGHSWKSDTSIPGCGTRDQPGNADECPSRQRYSDLCSIITNTTGPFQNCHLHIDPAPYYYSCVYDLCLYTRANGMLCSAVEAYKTACAILEIQISEWRSGLRCDVRDHCSELSCSEDERCGKKNGVYGCLCNNDQPKPEPDSFDLLETCESSSGSISVSRCQLFEAGFPADVLHLNDPSCKGTVRNGRVEFHYDNDKHICGTNLVANGTHFIYDNFILGTPRSEGLISREKILKLSFSCVYPQTQTLSMNVEINPLESVVQKILPAGEGRYRVRMIPYQDDEFTRPFTGAVDAELDQEMHVEVRVEGVDSRQFALVLDKCWATPVNDPDYSLRWDLIVSECPNPKDDTVELLQNGVSTSSRFSFRMFIFTANSTKLYLHCAVHLCLLSSNQCPMHCDSGHQRREGRSLDFHDSAFISMGPLVWSEQNSDIQIPEKVQVSKAPGLCGSLIILMVSLLCAYTMLYI
ncbi:LOW QUALITY PROTEIN: alpha-tectorin-like [Megalobrama amblycephala]|uniref:LOW QUALITY PROTEIN: alpha-tectorin-like n=1 Tax=Megalobrama amblycephala TaxID=75352 RepID=UPI002013C755|nr:LOW QUALITY PROTEIN: alpha-tectorin-like [Megalobrama amblycephala]